MISILTFHAILLLVAIISRRNVNFQLILSAITSEFHYVTLISSSVISILVPSSFTECVHQSSNLIFFSPFPVRLECTSLEHHGNTNIEYSHLFLYRPVITETQRFPTYYALQLHKKFSEYSQCLYLLVTVKISTLSCLNIYIYRLALVLFHSHLHIVLVL